MALELRSAFARRTGVSVPATLLLRETSTRATAERILQLAVGTAESAAQRTSGPVARCETLEQVPRARSRLFCFHDAGGSPAMFVPFCRLTTDGVEVHAMSHTRDGPPSAARGAQYIREAVSHILSASSRAPFALFGHSLGALLAWRLALELQALGDARPKLLIVSGSLSPEDWRGSSFSKDIELAFRLVFGVLAEGSQNLRRDFEADLTLSRAIPARAFAPLDIPIHAFRGSDDHVASESAMRRWVRCTTRAFSLTELPGTHSYFGQKGPRDVLLSALASQLAVESLVHGFAEGASAGYPNGRN
jgi:surfactin synthase thioesterase subunit